jgi:hypothetical protein
MNLRFVLVAFSLLAGCAAHQPCGPSSCQAGCCDEKGACVEFPTTWACGVAGAACAPCGVDQLCVDGACRPSGLGGGSAAGGGGGSAAFELEVLTAHNLVRRNAAPAPVPPLPALTWSPAAAAVAQAWAGRCTYAHNTGRGDLGENIFASTAAATASDAVVSWASEAPLYDLATNSCRGVCGHYTQLVWRATTSVGCASARCGTNSPFGGGSWTLVVCDYAPPGNVVGEKPW